MLLLTVAVLANLAIVVCFKLFPRHGVDTFSAIIVNYLASAALGSLWAGEIPLMEYATSGHTWTYYGYVLGFMFLFGFTIIAYSVRYTGVAITTAMQKMSLLVSVSYAVLHFHEPFGVLKSAGMVLAVIAIILITGVHKQKVFAKDTWHLFALPLGALLFSGIVESVLYDLHARDTAEHGDIAFTTFAFSVAASLGIPVVIYRAAAGHHVFNRKDVLWGLLLGIPNYFTIYLILALLASGFPGSVLYPLLNVLVLVVSALTGYFVFKEKLNKVKIIGIVIAIVVITLMSLTLD
jgi:drug/metabolite transporter (DMT)-like permease